VLHGERDRFELGMHSELAEDVAHVRLDGLRADEQLGGEGVVPHALGEVREEPAFAIGDVGRHADNTDYFTQSYSTDINYYITKSLILSTDFDYIRYTGQSTGFNRNVPLWNANIAKQLFKKKNG